MAPTQLFLSCVSAEFGSYRDGLRHNLDLPDVAVKIQEEFIAGGVPTLHKLDTYIQACDAVLHLVGDGLGSTAKPRSLAYLRRTYPDLAQRFPALAPFLAEGSASLSYTQWEAWLALLHGKKLLICVPGAGVPRQPGYQPDEAERGLQQAHLERLRGVEAYPEVKFLNLDQLTWKIQQALNQELRLASHQIAKARSDWRWPQAWDFSTYRAEKREGFVGRTWLFEEVRAWATNPQGEPALLIGADYGVGKSAFLAELVETGAAGLPLAAQHFCTTEQAATLTPELFVRSLAAQLADAIPAYRQALEADGAAELRRLLDEAQQDPARAFEQALLAPLTHLDAAKAPQLLVVDALDEAQDPLASAAPGASPTIVGLLARYAKRLPPWLKLLATSRRRPDVLKELRQAFTLKEINPEEARNLDDLRGYAVGRCQAPPLLERLEKARLTPEEIGEFLSAQQQSSGKFLYVTRVLNDLAAGLLPLQDRADLEALPPGLDGFYADAFARRFPSDQAYAPVAPILALLAEAREPLGRRDLAAILGWPEPEISHTLLPLRDFLRLRLVEIAAEGATKQDTLYSFDHLSLEQWLGEVDAEEGLPRAESFWIDRPAAAERIRQWALTAVDAGHAHTWPYLVRHLASHLGNDERAEVIARQLRQFPWLQARLQVSGLGALLGDFKLAKTHCLMERDASLEKIPIPLRVFPCIQLFLRRIGLSDVIGFRQIKTSDSLDSLERALQQSAHVLNNEEGWNGKEQLASQLLVRLVHRGELQDLRKNMTDWLRNRGGASPRTASLANHDALLRTLLVGSGVNAVVTLPDGRLASGCQDGTIRLWDPDSGNCTAVFAAHDRSYVASLAVLGDGRIASGSSDNKIRVWDTASGTCSTIFEGHRGCVYALAVLGDGRLASGSDDKTIRLWDSANGTCVAVLEGHEDYVISLVVIGDGLLASGSSDKTIRLWDLASGACVSILHGHESWVTSLGVLGDGRLASGSVDWAIRIWEPRGGTCKAVLRGHRNVVNSLAVLDDGRLASASCDKTIRLWDPVRGSCKKVIRSDLSSLDSLTVLLDGRLACGSHQSKICLWDPFTNDDNKISERRTPYVRHLELMSDGRLVSSAGRFQLSINTDILIWDPACGASSAVLHGHRGEVTSLKVLKNGRIACGSFNNTISLWDPASGACSQVFKGHHDKVNALALLGDGRLASGSKDSTIRLWDPASGTCSAVFEGHEYGVIALAVLGDGRLASGSNDSTIRLWDPASGTCSAVFEGHDGWVTALAVLGDGRLASGSAGIFGDNTIRLWDPASGTCCAVFQGHQSGVNALAVLGDGRLASGSDDRTIRLWDPRRPDGAPRVLFVADAAITALAWVPTHQLLVAGDASGRLHWLELGALQP